MAQEKFNSNDYDDFAQDLSELKKMIKSEDYVKVSIGFYKGGRKAGDESNWVRCYQYDIPREMYFRREWVIRWRIAKEQCKYPRENVIHFLCFYDKKTNFDPQKMELLQKITNHFIQIRKQERNLAQYDEYCKGLLFVTPAETRKRETIENRLIWRKKELAQLIEIYQDYENKNLISQSQTGTP